MNTLDSLTKMKTHQAQIELSIIAKKYYQSHKVRKKGIEGVMLRTQASQGVGDKMTKKLIDKANGYIESYEKELLQKNIERTNVDREVNKLHDSLQGVCVSLTQKTINKLMSE